MASEISAVRDWIVERLSSRTIFAGIPVLSHKAGDLQNKIEEAIGTLGLVAIVNTPTGDDSGAQRGPVTIDPLRIVVRIVENVTLNTTDVHAEDLLERTLAELKLQKPPGCAPLMFDRPAWRQLSLLPKPGEDDSTTFNAYDVFLLTKLSLSPAT